MFIANDSNYTFGQFLAVEEGDDIKAPVYSKCFTDTEALKGYRFIHDPEETDPEMCVCFSIYNETSSEAVSTPFEEFASVSDLTSVMFRLDTEIVEGVLREVPYYHVIVPVLNLAEETVEYLVIKMTKEVELFPENYPYYELVDTFSEAEPTSAEAPGGGGITPTGTIQITENDTYDVTNYASAEVNVPSDFTTATVTFINSSETPGSYFSISGLAIVDAENNMIYINDSDNLIMVETEYAATIPLYKDKYKVSMYIFNDVGATPPSVTGNVTMDNDEFSLIITGNGTFTCEGTGGED